MSGAITVVEEVFGFGQNDLSVINADVSNFQTGDNIIFTLDLSNPNSDPTTINLEIIPGAAIDEAGNENTRDPPGSGLHVLVRHHLDDSYSVWKGPHLLGRFDSSVNTMEQLRKKAA